MSQALHSVLLGLMLLLGIFGTPGSAISYDRMNSTPTVECDISKEGVGVVFGEQYDPDLGLYYLRARYYANSLGRFWTRDTWEGVRTRTLSQNKYAYAEANPTLYTDPSGYFVSSVGISFSTALSGGLRGAKGGITSSQAMTASAVMAQVQRKLVAYAVIMAAGAAATGVASYLDLIEWVDYEDKALVAAAVRKKVEERRRSSGNQILFHYGDYARVIGIVNSRSIGAAADFSVFSRAINERITFPSGAYGTDLPPWDTRYTQQELSALFYGGNPNRNMRFFVAFEAPDFSRLNRPGYPHQFVKYAPAGSRVPVKLVTAGPNLMNY